MALLKDYASLVESGQLRADDAQKNTVLLLHDYNSQITTYFSASSIKRLLNSSRHPGNLYIWGQVGSGKTMLMDMFYQHATVKKKRVHFAVFMRWLHTQLHDVAGAKNPLPRIAQQAARDTELLCFDEFQVTDIGDAMLLGNFLHALFNQRVVVCFTSNSAPQELYKDGLQRSAFLPAIALLERSCQVVSLDSACDYRQMYLKKSGHYLFPADKKNTARFFSSFTQFAHTSKSNSSITLQNRNIAVLRAGSESVCITFDELCRTARSTSDYLQLCEHYRAVFLAFIPCLGDNGDKDAVRRFITLIDVLYDNNIFLSCLAATDVRAIYSGEYLREAYARCLSRLIEMQSQKYLQRCF